MGIPGRKGNFSLKNTDTDPGEVYWERVEDLLTADVFGAYRYLPPRLGILPLLEHARDEHGYSLFGFLRARGAAPEGSGLARIRFWPSLTDGSEPDVLVILGAAACEPAVALLVEAKLHSPQHEIDGCSQIGHYLQLHLQGLYADHLADPCPSLRPLLFVTAHPAIPGDQLARARREAHDHHPEIPLDDIGVFWVSWVAAGGEAQRLWQQHRQQVVEQPWLRLLMDVVQDLAARDLMPRPPFMGIPPPPPMECSWSYLRPYRLDLPGGTVAAQPLSLMPFGVRPAFSGVPEAVFADRQCFPPLPWSQLPYATTYRGGVP